LKRVIFAPDALIDLLKIQEHIEQFNPGRSVTFVTELRTKANNISHFPGAYPARDDLQSGLRMAIHGHYNIFFRATDLKVEIVRIVHGARDLRVIFRNE
jgi:toxin ParE1/3/4